MRSLKEAVKHLLNAYKGSNNGLSIEYLAKDLERGELSIYQVVQCTGADEKEILRKTFACYKEAVKFFNERSERMAELAEKNSHKYEFYADVQNDYSEVTRNDEDETKVRTLRIEEHKLEGEA